VSVAMPRLQVRSSSGFRRSFCPWCKLEIPVDTEGLFRRHASVRERAGAICAFSGGVSDLPDVRTAPRTDRVGRLALIKARARTVRT